MMVVMIRLDECLDKGGGLTSGRLDNGARIMRGEGRQIGSRPNASSMGCDKSARLEMEKYLVQASKSCRAARWSTFALAVALAGGLWRWAGRGQVRNELHSCCDDVGVSVACTGCDIK